MKVRSLDSVGSEIYQRYSSSSSSSNELFLQFEMTSAVNERELSIPFSYCWHYFFFSLPVCHPFTPRPDVIVGGGGQWPSASSGYPRASALRPINTTWLFPLSLLHLIDNVTRTETANTTSIKTLNWWCNEFVGGRCFHLSVGSYVVVDFLLYAPSLLRRRLHYITVLP